MVSSISRISQSNSSIPFSSASRMLLMCTPERVSQDLCKGFAIERVPKILLNLITYRLDIARSSDVAISAQPLRRHWTPVPSNRLLLL